MDNSTDVVRAKVEKALQEAFLDCGEMLTKWVVVVNTVTSDDGKDGVWTLMPNGQAPWDTHGLLHFAQIKEDAHQTWHEFDDHNHD